MLLENVNVDSWVVTRHEFILFWNHERIDSLSLPPLINRVSRLLERQLKFFLKTPRQLFHLFSLFLQRERSLRQKRKEHRFRRVLTDGLVSKRHHRLAIGGSLSLHDLEK